MADYTHKNLADVKDQAVDFGYSPQLEARFAREELGAESTGFSFQRLQPDVTAPFGHSHDEAEEVYVVLEGSGRMKLDDDVIDIRPLDAIRVAPKVLRAFAAGPDGLAYIAFGPHHKGDGAVKPDAWES
jgi:mannose-6-phosphate isomerase-like protein (cupin superfamily)